MRVVSSHEVYDCLLSMVFLPRLSVDILFDAILFLL